tara:strand:- start:21590 stop:22642 length:1053 start_codon:yes stop_codon:yes gene_type:complete
MTIKVAIVGVGNCASSLIQGLTYYGDDADPQGVMQPVLGGYRPSDIEIVAAFDIDGRKVGQDLSQAILAKPNCTMKFAEVPTLGVTVQRGPTLDGRGPTLEEAVLESLRDPVNVADELRISGAEIVVGYLPVGSEDAVRFYAQAAVDAGCGYVNAVPVFIASDPAFAQKFHDAGLPLIGDDIKSQVGATIVHRVLANLMHARGYKLERTSQLNVGGNTDFMNMLDRTRLASKKISKTQAVTSVMGLDLAPENVHVGPSDYVPWLLDRKWAHIRLEGTGFGGAPMVMELKLEVHDSPNSAGVVMDAIRCAKVALDRGLGGPILPPSACYMKSPPVQVEDYEAFEELQQWLS